MGIRKEEGEQAPALHRRSKWQTIRHQVQHVVAEKVKVLVHSALVPGDLYAGRVCSEEGNTTGIICCIMA